MADVEQVAEGCPQCRCELSPSVKCDDGWHPKMGDPAGKLGFGAVCRVIEKRGIVSGQRDILSITVTRYV
jgi:hypothetical protein